MAGIVGIILKIRPGEWGKVGTLCLHLLSGTATLIISRTLINALFLKAYDSSYLPYVFGTQAIFFVIISAGYSWFAGRLSRRLVTNVFLLVFLGSIILWRFNLFYKQGWTAFILYVWMETFTLVIMMQCWLAVNDSCDSRQGKRLFPVVQAGGTTGAVLGGIISKVLVKSIGTENLLFCCIPMVLITLMTAQYIIAKYISDLPDSGSTKEEIKKGTALTSLRKGLQRIFGDKLLIVLLIIFVTTTVAATILDFQFKTLLRENYTKDEIAAFIGTFYAIANPCTLIILLLFTNRLLMMFGIAFGLAAIPLFLFAGSVVFVLYPLFVIIVGTKFFEEVARFSLRKSSWELAYVPFSPDRKRKVSIVFNGIFGPSAVLLASLVLILSTRSLTIREISFLVATLCAVGVVASVWLNKPYAEKLKDSLSSRKIRLHDISRQGVLIGRQAKELIEQSLSVADKHTVLFSLQLIKDFQVPVDLGKVESLFKNEDPEIKTTAVRTIGISEDRGRAGKIIILLRVEKDPNVKKECIKALGRLAEEDISDLVFNYLKDPDPMVRAESIISLITAGGLDGIIVGAEELKRLIDSQDNCDLRTAAYAIGEIGSNFFRRSLKNLMTNDSIEVKSEAIKAAGKIHSDEFLPMLVECLKDSNVARLARESIANYQPTVIPVLLKEYEKEQTSIFFQIQIIKTLENFHCYESASKIVDFLASSSFHLRYQAIKSLNKLRRSEMLDLSSFREVILERMRSELKEGYSLYKLLSLLDKEMNNGFLKEEVKHRLNRVSETLFRLLAIIYDQSTIYRAFLNYMSQQSRQKANAIELLDTILERNLSKTLLPFLEDIPLYEKLKRIKEEPGFVIKKDTYWLDIVMKGKDKWLKNVTIWHEKEKVRERFPDEFERRKEMIPVLEKIYFLKGVSLFSSLSGETLMQFVETFKYVSFENGETIFAEADPGDSFYVILRGKVKVTRHKREIATLGERDCFGEMALLEYAPRTGTVTVLEDCDLLRLDKEDFDDLLEEYPELAKGVMQILSQRLRSMIESDDTVILYHKTNLT